MAMNFKDIKNKPLLKINDVDWFQNNLHLIFNWTMPLKISIQIKNEKYVEFDSEDAKYMFLLRWQC